MNTPRSRDVYLDPRVTAPDQCRYDAGCEIPANVLARGDALLRDWLPSSGMQLDSRPMFEYYPGDSGYDPVTGVLECRLCVPVMPLQ
jgi:AraC family transcriptional regulator